MARKRTNPDGKGLPERWTYKHGAYYYRVKPGKEAEWDNKQWFPLGTTLSDAFLEYGKRVKEVTRDIQTIGQLLDRYLIEVAPEKAAKTYKDNIKQSRWLKKIFENTLITSILPMDIYKYTQERGKLVSARLEIALLSHSFTKAVEWGLIHKHPFKGEIRLKTSKARTRYVEDWEIIEVLSLVPVREKGSVLLIQAYIELKLLLGLRLSDILRIKETDIQDNGIHAHNSKTGKSVIYTWTPTLRKAVEKARKARPLDICQWLFCNKFGECYVAEDGMHSGWDSMWQRFMTRILKETEIKDRFTEHDLRAKVASDAETLEHAQKLLAHADSKTTNKIYRRKAELVTPAR